MSESSVMVSVESQALDNAVKHKSSIITRDLDPTYHTC